MKVQLNGTRALLDNDPRKRINKSSRPKPRKSRILLPLDGEQLDWALMKHPTWVFTQLPL